jgi:hypothetical protein
VYRHTAPKGEAVGANENEEEERQLELWTRNGRVGSAGVECSRLLERKVVMYFKLEIEIVRSRIVELIYSFSCNSFKHSW